jgi:hypothetical protein
VRIALHALLTPWLRKAARACAEQQPALRATTPAPARVRHQGECHTRQHFHYMGHCGELHADQAHRGYDTATDAGGYAALNPLYMRCVRRQRRAHGGGGLWHVARARDGRFFAVRLGGVVCADTAGTFKLQRHTAHLPDAPPSAHHTHATRQPTTHHTPHTAPTTLRRYTPDANGLFAGQSGYGYVSIAAFIEAAASLNSGARSAAHYEQEGQLALAASTLAVTAILQAGRLSLDNRGAPVDIMYGDDGQPHHVRLAAAAPS